MSPPAPTIKPAVSPHWGVFLACGLIVLAALAAYCNSFSGPFILDDSVAITNNPSIKHLGSVLSPPASSTAGGRPLINLTFALNYALGGLNVWGYHALNLAIHIFAALILFGVVRRTLREHPTPNAQHPTSKASHSLHGLSSAEALPLALAVAVIWVVHPLQTEAVTYISQRAESLMGLFYLLTLYCFIRAVECRSGFTPDIRLRPSFASATEGKQAYGGQVSGINPDLQPKRGNPPNSQLPALNVQFSTFNSRIWSLGSIFCCLLGAATKEVMVTAPVLVFLYDRTFVAGSFREAWRLRWRYYLGLACTWLLLARLMTGLGQRSVGFDQGVTWWNYALTSCRSVVLYLKMAVWPHPLVFDYGAALISRPADAVPYALVLAALLTAVLIALRYRPGIGFAGAWFFLILAPTSSVVPVAGQPIAEHRMYLPLAAMVVWVALGLYRLIGRRSVMILLTLAAGLGWLTVQRNQDYKSELSIWTDTVTNCPDNARAHSILGNVLLDLPGRLPDAIAQYEVALRIDPNYAEAHLNLGNVLRGMPGRLPDAITQYEAALRLDPISVPTHVNLGTALLSAPGRLSDAIAQFRAALRLDPDLAEAHNDLGNALFNLPGRLPDAIAQYKAALRLKPNSVSAHFNLANAWLKMPGRTPDAIAQLQAALRLKPDLRPARELLDHLEHPTPNIQLPTSKAEGH
jgi:tetratricopeptide (TPR) repeat protein